MQIQHRFGPLSPAVSVGNPSEAPIDPEMLPSGTNEVKEGTIKQAAESFGAYLYAQMFAQMRPDSSEEGEGGLFSGDQVGMFMNFFDQAIGKDFVKSSGGLLVDQLVQQLSAQNAQKGHS